MNKPVTHICTIGHSTRSLEDFLAILKHYNINELVDIRTIPKSRHNPQFNGPDLAHFLRNHHIGYRHQKNLGGLRHAHADSQNKAWHNASFRGFADYMQTDGFKKGLEELIKLSQEKIVAVMCSEAVPWRCHRSLIGDALLMHHIEVRDIYNLHTVKLHTLTAWAKVQGPTITYPAQTEIKKE